MARTLLTSIAILLVLAACGGSPQSAASRTAAARRAAAATATPAGASASPQAGGAAGAGTGAAQQPAYTPLDPGPMRLPEPGTYKAQITHDGSASSASISISISHSSSAESDVTTTTTLSNGGQEINSEAWRPDGIYLKSTSFTSGGNRIDCTFSQPVLESKLPLAVGSSWNSSGTCTTPAPNSSTTTLTLNLSVTGTARQVIGGVTVATYVVKGTLTTDTKGSYAPTINGVPGPAQPFELKTTSQLTVYLDAAAGLEVRTITDSTTDTNGKASSSTSETQLASIKPS